MFGSVEELLVEYCSPTLASIKAANMFSTGYESLSVLESAVERLNLAFFSKGVKITILSHTLQRALLYVYREAAIENILADQDVQDFLFCYGYTDFCSNKAIEKLRTRFLLGECFPHEIGVFLGYPLIDVKGFIQEGGCNYKCSGCWKVYGSKDDAIRYFKKLERCRETYKRLYKNGFSLDKLTVRAV